MTGGHFPDPNQYDYEELRELYDGSSYVQIDEDPNYKCKECGWYAEVDDYQKHTPNWCDSCNDVMTFVRLSDE